MKVIPNVFAHNKNEFVKRFVKVLSCASHFQIDFMDGKFVKGKSIALHQVPPLKKYKKKFEAHLMVNHPQKYILPLKKKGFDKVIIHIESDTPQNIFKTLELIKKHDMIPAITLSAQTPLTVIEPFVPKVRYVQFMGIFPGKERQTFIPSVYKKIKAFKKKYPQKIVQVDGGVNDKTAGKLALAGADFLNTGSFVGNALHPKQAIAKLKEVYYEALH